MALTDQQMTRIGDVLRDVLGDEAVTPSDVSDECEHVIEQWIEDSEEESSG